MVVSYIAYFYSGSQAAKHLLRPAASLTSVRLFNYERPDYYGILGVKKHASEKEIKVAYLNMARKFHPDKNKNLDAKYIFKLVAEAYEVLTDEKRRTEYDETGFSRQHYGGRAEGPERQDSDPYYTPEQMYQKIFGAEKEAHHKENVHEDFAESYSGLTATHEYIAKLSMEEAANGLNMTIQLRVVAVCNKCEGCCSEMGYTGNICPYCEGTGQETIRTGHYVARKTCEYCHGSKIFIKFKCLECEGTGKIVVARPYQITIPPGVTHGQVLKFELEQSKLDLRYELEKKERQIYVTVSVVDSDVFSRKGNDLESDVELSVGQAVLGGTINTRGIRKALEVDVPAGTSSHKTFVLAGEGIQPFDETPGDHLLKTSIRCPERLNFWQKRVIMSYAAIEDRDNGTVNGVPGLDDHKYSFNVVVPSKVKNLVVLPKAPDEMDISLGDQIRKKLGFKTI